MDDFYLSENGSSRFKIIGSSKIGNGNLIYPTPAFVDKMYIDNNSSYLFKCELSKDGSKIFRYISKF